METLATPPIAAHGLIGDRRTAALVARDGSIDWCCLPVFDGDIVFGALLDTRRGGRWRLGPRLPAEGRQEYVESSSVLRTLWSEPAGALELTDCMPLPPDDAADTPRVILRRLRCTSGRVDCVHQLNPRLAFGAPVPVHTGPASHSEGAWLGLWSSDPSLAGRAAEEPVHFTLDSGQAVWLALEFRARRGRWSPESCDAAIDATVRAWAEWGRRHPVLGPRRESVLASLRALRLLSYEPSGSQVAAPTTSLPERIGGDRNYDYRFAWVRDSSLALAIMAVFGDHAAAERYMDWLAGLSSHTEMPLQVVYGIAGGCELPECVIDGVEGYAGSRPVRVGNRAARQLQLDSLGYLADCALIYLEQGGRWKPEYTKLVERLATFTAANWQRKDSGIWELEHEQHYVSSRMLGWVVFDRAEKVFRRLGRAPDPQWQQAARAIHEEVMARGWSPHRQAFRQHYDSDELDASTLLAGVMGFLPEDHPRVAANVAAIERELLQDGFVWRFHPRALGHDALFLQGLEGAFLPCTFWLAAALARLQRTDEAQALLEKVEGAFAPLGLFSEEFDPRRGAALGNYPLLFAHAEHLRAVMDLARARPLLMVGMMAGKMAGKVVRALDPD